MGRTTRLCIERHLEPHPRVLLRAGSRCLDLSGFLRATGRPDGVAQFLGEGLLEAGRVDALLADSAWEGLELESAPGPPRLGPPLLPREVGKILALGKNFRAHAAEFGEEVPEEPLFFNKLPECLVGHGHRVRVEPWYGDRVDHEVELALIIGRAGKYVPLDRAMEHVAGYTVANDLTARTLQAQDRNHKFPWFRAKNMDGFCPIGPVIVPRDSLDIANLRVSARVNGELRQDASTRELVVDVPHALAALSRHLTLRVGDIVLMGTPEGVGPLEDGDEVRCAIEGIGELAVTIERPVV